MPSGTVIDLWRWPVKSMAGERLASTRMDARGLGGDRTHAVTFVHKGEVRPLTAREAPRLLAWRAGYPFAGDAALRPDDPPAATVRAPGGKSFSCGATRACATRSPTTSAAPSTCAATPAASRTCPGACS